MFFRLCLTERLIIGRFGTRLRGLEASIFMDKSQSHLELEKIARKVTTQCISRLNSLRTFSIGFILFQAICHSLSGPVRSSLPRKARNRSLGTIS